MNNLIEIEVRITMPSGEEHALCDHLPASADPAAYPVVAEHVAKVMGAIRQQHPEQVGLLQAELATKLEALGVKR
ncbi:hypothetical protein [Rhodococcus pyridinivorans]|uniref:hypothetical protein n=1 Tax=Rhodococcus pyridinivorans TaxID=103816 RepID=UPI000AC2B294|nr:hypothetical protein [Rhodococcus pyridinivorans]